MANTQAEQDRQLDELIKGYASDSRLVVGFFKKIRELDPDRQEAVLRQTRGLLGLFPKPSETTFAEPPLDPVDLVDSSSPTKK